MFNKTTDDEPVCVCVYYEFLLQKIRYCLFLTIIREYTISYKNSWHTRNLVVAHKSQNTGSEAADVAAIDITINVWCS
jgi:hypothetical protein